MPRRPDPDDERVVARAIDVAGDEDLLDRVLGCGTLVVGDAGTHGRVTLRDVPDAERPQRSPHDLLHEVHATSPGPEEGH